MFCTICAPQIEREIAMCCWRVSVINLVSKWRDGEGERQYRERESLLFTEQSFHTFSVTTNLKNNEQFLWRQKNNNNNNNIFSVSQTNNWKWDSLRRQVSTGLGMKQQHHSEDKKKKKKKHLKLQTLARYWHTHLRFTHFSHLITCSFTSHFPPYNLKVKVDGGVSAQLFISSPSKSWLDCAEKRKKKKPLAQAFLSLYYILLSIIPVIYEENESKDAEEEGRYTLI